MSDSNLTDDMERQESTHGENGADGSTGGLADDEHNDSDIPSEHNISNSVDASEDPELEAIKARVREMEEEAERLKIMQEVMNDAEDKHDADSPNGKTSANAMIIRLFSGYQ